MVKYGKECATDQNCGSGVCEMTYNDAGQAKGRFCVIQEKKKKKKCKYNKDCVLFKNPPMGKNADIIKTVYRIDVHRHIVNKVIIKGKDV